MHGKNKRRFFRFDVDIPFHIAAKQAQLRHFEEERSLPMSGAVFFSEVVNTRIEKKRNDFKHNLSKVKNQPKLKDVIISLHNKIEFFISNAELFCSGHNPYLKNYKFGQELSMNEKEISPEFEGNPKTTEILKKIDRSSIVSLRMLGQVSQKSTVKKIQEPNYRLMDSVFSDLAKVVTFLGQKKSPLTNSILALVDMLKIAIDTLFKFLDEQTLIEKPAMWKHSEVNLSAGGFAIKSTTEIPATTRAMSCMKLGEIVLNLDATVVNCHKLNENEYVVRCMFDLCPSDTMDKINGFIQSREIRDAMRYVYQHNLNVGAA